MLLDWNSARLNGIFHKGVVGAGAFSESVVPNGTIYTEYFRSFTLAYGATLSNPRVLFMMVDANVGDSYAYSNYIISDFLASSPLDTSAAANHASVYATADVTTTSVTFKVFMHETTAMTHSYSRNLDFYYIIFYG